MNNIIKDTIIIGAGLSGLITAKKLLDLDLGSVLVLEKSRGIGGRMATRRTLETRFDHGAQFYRVKADISEFHQLWSKVGLSHQWFVSSKGDHWCAKSGMTSLAKELAVHVEFQLEKQVHLIKFNSEDKIWILISDKGEEWFCRQLIVSAPTPQTLQLFERSNLMEQIEPNTQKELQKLSYSKALIALVTLKDDITINDHGYEEFIHGDFFSLSDQKIKGISTIPAITITMSPSFSENSFDLPDDQSLAEIIKKFLQRYPHASIIGSELKKWRYCQATHTFKDLYAEVLPNLFLIGDAFGGSSLLGAVRSAEALVEAFLDE